MTNELKAVTKKIDVAFTLYFMNKKDVETIFVVGSMAHDDYQDRLDNDYDIRVISKKVMKEDIQDFEHFLSVLSQKLSTDEIQVGYSCLVGPVNHKVSTNKKLLFRLQRVH